jgi:hypothetical protein
LLNETLTGLASPGTCSAREVAGGNKALGWQ